MEIESDLIEIESEISLHSEQLKLGSKLINLESLEYSPYE